jgi:hypothetical protein
MGKGFRFELFLIFLNFFKTRRLQVMVSKKLLRKLYSPEKDAAGCFRNVWQEKKDISVPGMTSGW